jgi:hypothetical protein
MSKPTCTAILLGLLCLTVVSICQTALAGPRFKDNGDGTVTDNQLGLMWAKTDNRKDIEWNRAESWAKRGFAKTIKSKYNNWRLPTIEELRSLYVSRIKYKGYVTNCGLVVKIVPEIRLSCILLWSSETALGSHLAFNFNIGDSFSVPSYDISGCRALTVRSLE